MCVYSNAFSEVKMKANVKSTILLFLTAIIWGFAFVAQLIGSEHIGTFTFNGIRFLLGSLSLIPVILIFERGATDKAMLKYSLISGAVTGVILFAAASLQQLGVEITRDAGKSGFITGLYIVLVPIFGIFLGKKPTAFTWISAAVSIVGLYFLCMGGNEAFGTGDIVLLVGSFFWAAHILIIDHCSPHVYAIRYASTQFAVCGIISMICSFIFEKPEAESIMNAALPLLYGGVLSAGIAYTLQIIGQRDCDPTYSAIIMSTESVFGAIGGMLVLHQYMTPRGYLGSALIFTGIILSQLNPKKILKHFKNKKTN